MRIKNGTLKRRIFEAGTTQKGLGEKVGISEPVMSMIVNGKYVPTEDEKRRIANTIGCTVKEIFPE